MNTPIATTTTRPGRSRWAVALAAGVAGLLGLSSVAWACTQIMSSLKICSPSTGTCTDTFTGTKGNGAPGSTIKVKNTSPLRGKNDGATYALYFVDSAGLRGDPNALPPVPRRSCHTAIVILKSPSGVTLNKMTTDKAGYLDRNLTRSGVQPYKAVIPATASEGDAEICAREVTPEPEATATEHAIFTIIGGS